MQTIEIYTSTATDPGGHAAAGVVLRDAEGHTLGVSANAFGRMAGEEAAYRALLAGLWRAKRTRAQRVRVYIDNADVVAQLQGHGAIPPTFVGLYLQVRAMLNAYRWRSLAWIDRTRNAEAALAAMEALEHVSDANEVEALPLWQSAERVLV